MSVKTGTDYSGQYIFTSAIWAGEESVFKLKKRETVAKSFPGQRYRIFFAGIGISDARFLQAGELPFARTNVQKFASVLQRHADSLKGIAEYTPQLFYGHVTRSDVMPFLQLFREAGKNDICVLYYSGIGLANPVLEKGFLDFLFSDDPVESGQYTGSTDSGIFNYLETVAEKTNTNLIVIADLFRSVMFNDTQREQNIPEMNGTNFILLQNCSPHKVRPLNAEEAPFPDNNVFSETLIGLLEADGFHYSYKELFERLVLRMSQTEENRRPKFYAEPANSADRRILSTVLKESAVYELYFNGSTSEWRLNAGMDRGIRPSIPFMETIFRIDDSVQVAVKSVHEDYSIVSKPGSLSPGTYPATLVQQSVPKIKIAFSPAVSPEQKNALMEVVNRSGLHLLEITDHSVNAGYIIHFTEGGYSLARSSEEKEEFSIKPVFRPQPDPLAFINEMEAIAKWQGILELENPSSKFNDKSLSVSFDIVEGFPFDEMIDQSPATAEVTDPDRVILHYIRPEREWVAPAFRCRIYINAGDTAAGADQSKTNSFSESPAKIGSTRPLFVNQLYLGNQFAIGGVHFLLEKQTDKDYYELKFSAGTDLEFRKTIPVSVTDYQMSNGIFETYHYLKIFISEEPIDLQPLWQDALMIGNQAEINTTTLQKKLTEAIRFPGGGWHSITVPIKITYGQKEDIYK